MALERRVLLRASSNSLLVAVSGGILRALRPLRYRGVFVPVLPTSLADYADAPTPYLMGHRTRGPPVRGGTSAVSASSGDRHDGGSNPGLNGSNNSFLDEALTAELTDHVRSRLGKHAFPREIAFVESLPKTPSGKIQRFILRKES